MNREELGTTIARTLDGELWEPWWRCQLRRLRNAVLGPAWALLILSVLALNPWAGIILLFLYTTSMELRPREWSRRLTAEGEIAVNRLLGRIR